MKKLINLSSKFILLAFLLTFISSCGSENDPVLVDENEKTEVDPTEYSVRLTIDKSSFNIEQTPFTRTGDDPEELPALYIMVYYKNTQLSRQVKTVSWKEIMEQTPGKNEGITASLTLPKGDYIFAIIKSNGGKFEDFIMFDNFNTDYYGFRGEITRETFDIATNYNVYYESIVVSITSDMVIEKPIELKPMWANLDFTITDLYAQEIPSGCYAASFMKNNHYYGFSLKTKLASSKFDPEKYYGSYYFSTRFANHGEFEQYFSIPVAKGVANNNMSFEIKKHLYPVGGGDFYYEYKQLELDKKYQIENGYNYFIKGSAIDIFDAERFKTTSVEVTLGGFKDQNIEF